MAAAERVAALAQVEPVLAGGPGLDGGAAAADVVGDDAAGAVGDGAAVFANVPAEFRIGGAGLERDQTFVIAVAIVLLLHVGAVVGSIQLGDAVPDLADRRGQVDGPRTIQVELVEAPDARSKALESQMGKVAPPAPPPVEQPPPQPPPQPEQKQQPQVPPQQAEPKPQPKPEPEKSERADDGPDPAKDTKEETETAMAAPSEARDKAEPSPPTPPAPPPPPEASEFLGAAPPGKESAYGKKVRETLAKTKPQLWIRAAEVKVGLLLSRTGEVRLVKVIQSSNDPVFDDVVVTWIKRAKFERPPADAKPADLAHVIHYVISDR